MKPQLLALLPAAAWGVGGYFEKRGLVLGGETITVKTVLGMALTVGGIVLLTTG
jgi:hypothetical protein